MSTTSRMSPFSRGAMNPAKSSTRAEIRLGLRTFSFGPARFSLRTAGLSTTEDMDLGLFLEEDIVRGLSVSSSPSPPAEALIKTESILLLLLLPLNISNSPNLLGFPPPPTQISPDLLSLSRFLPLLA
ncbi:hypothetical protein Mapa_014030 [Marchantia paleacea]|nr:hypothetical protein Mapa_014030 [Marchantia paleacea]